MCTKSLLIILCLAAFLFACPAMFETRANSGARDYQTQDKIIAPTAVQLQVVLSGLSNTVYMTHAHDGTNRLFVIEKVGRIRVAQPGSSATTVFLDISSRVLSTGNEQGLLGLAFHPQYAANGRFFVYYTRAGDGALTIERYQRDARFGHPFQQEGIGAHQVVSRPILFSPIAGRLNGRPNAGDFGH